MIWTTRRTAIDLSRHARVMGILNVTPDSFSDGGHHPDAGAAIRHARRLIEEGADFIDIGGESTRPGSRPVPIAEEIARTVPVIEALRNEWDGWISIDTSKAGVAAAALAAGADIVNDVSGLESDPGMAETCAEAGCGVVVMHMQGNPRTMQEAPRYDDVVLELRQYFSRRMAVLERAGIAREALCFDPGIGFGKTLGHNLALLRALDSLSPAGRPLMLGVSRKSMIGQLLGNPELALRDWPTVALTAKAREKGVMLHRVHKVRPNYEALRMVEAIVLGVDPEPSAAH